MYSSTASRTGIFVGIVVAVDAVLFVVHLDPTGPFSAIASHTGSFVVVVVVDNVVAVDAVFFVVLVLADGPVLVYRITDRYCCC